MKSRKQKIRVQAACLLVLSLFIGLMFRKATTPVITLDVYDDKYVNSAESLLLEQLPETMKKITVAIPNHIRPENTKLVLQYLVTYDIVNEIIVWDDPASPKHSVKFRHPKVYVIEIPEFMGRWGMLGRFKLAMLAKNEHILIQDDDQLISELGILKMLLAKASNPDRLICYHGRQTSSPEGRNRISYILKDPPAPSYVPICLTKLLLTDKRFCAEATRDSWIVEDLVRVAKPYWNGEDIWHSLTAIRETGKLHIVLPIDKHDYTALPSPNGIGDPVKGPGKFNHLKYRDSFTREAAQRLKIDGSNLYPILLDPDTLQPISDNYTTKWYRGSTDICIVSQSSGTYGEFSLISTKNHRDYAARNGYSYRFYSGRLSGDEFVDKLRGDLTTERGGAHHWQKLIAVGLMMDTKVGKMPLCSWIMWIDSDIIFSNFNRKLEPIIDEYAHNYTVAILSREEAGGTSINSGAFFVRNSVNGRTFLHAIAGMYHDYKNPNKFVKLHDQDAIQDYVFQQPRDTPKYYRNYDELVQTLRPELTVAPQRTFNSFDRGRDTDPIEAQWQKCDLIAHMSGSTNARRAERMREIMKEVKDCTD